VPHVSAAERIAMKYLKVLFVCSVFSVQTIPFCRPTLYFFETLFEYNACLQVCTNAFICFIQGSVPWGVSKARRLLLGVRLLAAMVLFQSQFTAYDSCDS
jgi:hypothetical protein